MKKIQVRFERDETLEHIDVVIRASSRDAAVTKLMEQLSGEPPDVLDLTDTDGTPIQLVTDDVISVSVSDKLTLLITEDGRHIVRQPLQSIEQALDARRFLRISRHELVNTDKIEQYEFSANGTLRLVLAGGIETWASRRCIPAIRARLKGKE